ncbi:uncharacterized protein N7459_010118 [Penicillium hispanicum]|uniref:uncharacterized protein n=1 Tax=Penicillium hispanicum TaxID=1080232 RepID=UPI0025420B25|nr:uncharacterized protein N7459_010118 [Penicillium hispanicum]KAJ5566736.1 hypothetical protein N7459_010118 [Penicillium hispanicum]
MRISSRISITMVLVVTVLLVRRHLNSISSPPQLSGRATYLPEFVLSDAGAHIELVSEERGSHQVAISTSSTITTPRAAPSASKSKPKSGLHSEPTKAPVTPTQFAPEVIPVQVPGEDDDFDPLQQDWDLERPQDGYSLGWKHRNSKPKPKPPKPTVTPKTDRTIVLGRMSWEDTAWLEEELPESVRRTPHADRWQHAVYAIDEPNSEYSVQANKGKESNVYLQYIMDHYHKLPEYMVFLHADRFSWHTEFEEQDNALTVQHLQLDFLNRTGYVNLRCDWEPGCPDEVHPFRQMAERTTEIAFAGAWMGIFNNTDIPDTIAAPCCAQFAVTRKQVLARPLSDYQAYHSWLMATELDDETSGRVFEYLWHIIFGQDPVFCPTKEQCYLDVYGMEYVEPVIEWDDDIVAFWDPNQDPPEDLSGNDAYWELGDDDSSKKPGNSSSS